MRPQEEQAPVLQGTGEWIRIAVQGQSSLKDPCCYLAGFVDARRLCLSI